ncbi:hypothetical protein LCGC14_0957280 [marine sediment metagenome]|uniref:Uncharacterized protein n=1 Tax=marine sediment metagenome TaxID=412755 RepID=A0A0F9NFK2_9ZZZZ
MKLPKELQEKKKKKRKSIVSKHEIEFSKLNSKINKKCRFTGCLFPDRTLCSSISGIKAHSIQRNKILTSINYIEIGILL